MILEIVKYPDPILRQKNLPVAKIDDSIKSLAENMLETMYSANGVGLAAPQIGKNLRMLVMDPCAGEEIRCPKVVINPELELAGETILSPKEGCLSVPLGFRADVSRNNRVILKYIDLSGNSIEEILEDFPAIVIQHEFDHLEGKLFIDRMSYIKRSLYENKVKKWLKQQN